MSIAFNIWRTVREAKVSRPRGRPEAARCRFVSGCFWGWRGPWIGRLAESRSSEINFYFVRLVVWYKSVRQDVGKSSPNFFYWPKNSCSSFCFKRYVFKIAQKLPKIWATFERKLGTKVDPSKITPTGHTGSNRL